MKDHPYLPTLHSTKLSYRFDLQYVLVKKFISEIHQFISILA